MRNRAAVVLLSLVFAFCVSCGRDRNGTTNTANSVIYVNFVHHNEEYIDYVNNPHEYETYRNQLLRLAEYLHEEGIVMNIQSDWTFLVAVLNNEIPDSPYLDRTLGKNVLQYLKQDLGHEIDPHAHETQYNYADVAYLLELLGVEPSAVTGGFIAIPPDESVYYRFLSAIQGRVFPEYSWQASLLWGGASRQHMQDIYASGIWRPKSGEEFFVHDPTAPLPHIGGYTFEVGGVYDLIDRLDRGVLLPAKMYTATIFIPGDDIDNSLEELKREMPRLHQHKEEGKIDFASLLDTGRIWQNRYKSDGNVYIPAYATPGTLSSAPSGRDGKSIRQHVRYHRRVNGGDPSVD